MEKQKEGKQPSPGGSLWKVSIQDSKTGHDSRNIFTFMMDPEASMVDQIITSSVRMYGPEGVPVVSIIPVLGMITKTAQTVLPPDEVNRLDLFVTYLTKTIDSHIAPQDSLVVIALPIVTVKPQQGDAPTVMDALKLTPTPVAPVKQVIEKEPQAGINIPVVGGFDEGDDESEEEVVVSIAAVKKKGLSKKHNN